MFIYLPIYLVMGMILTNSMNMEEESDLTDIWEGFLGEGFFKLPIFLCQGENVVAGKWKLERPGAEEQLESYCRDSLLWSHQLINNI